MVLPSAKLQKLYEEQEKELENLRYHHKKLIEYLAGDPNVSAVKTKMTNAGKAFNIGNNNKQKILLHPDYTKLSSDQRKQFEDIMIQIVTAYADFLNSVSKFVLSIVSLENQVLIRCCEDYLTDTLNPELKEKDLKQLEIEAKTLRNNEEAKEKETAAGTSTTGESSTETKEKTDQELEDERAEKEFQLDLSIATRESIHQQQEQKLRQRLRQEFADSFPAAPISVDDDEDDEDSLRSKNKKLKEEIAKLRASTSRNANSTLIHTDESTATASPADENFLTMLTKVITKQDEEKQDGYKVPVAQIPTFKGERLEYTDFKDNFIEITKKLSQGQKYQLLRQSLQGEALNCIKRLNTNPSSYDECWRLLDKRYYEREEIFLNILDTMMSTKISERSSRAEIIEAIDTWSTMERNLKLINLSTSETTMVIFGGLARRNLTEHFKEKLVNKKRKSNEQMLTLDDVIDFLTIESKTYKQPAKSNQQPQRHVKVHYATQGTSDQCLICSGPHEVKHCLQFLQAPKRSDLLIRKRVCLFCLKHLYNKNVMCPERLSHVHIAKVVILNSSATEKTQFASNQQLTAPYYVHQHHSTKKFCFPQQLFHSSILKTRTPYVELYWTLEQWQLSSLEI